MLIEKLPLGIAINANIRIEPQHLATPQPRPLIAVFHSQDQLPQPRLRPQPLRETGIFDLEAVVDADGVAFLGDAGCGCEGQGAQERDVFGAEGGGPEDGDCEDLVGEESFEG